PDDPQVLRAGVHGAVPGAAELPGDGRRRAERAGRRGLPPPAVADPGRPGGALRPGPVQYLAAAPDRPALALAPGVVVRARALRLARAYGFTVLGIAIGVAGLTALGAMSERIVRFIEGGDRFVLGQISVAGRGLGMG